MTEILWLLSAADQAKLMQFQYDEYGELLIIPNEPKQEPHRIPVDTDMELEEIAKFMSEAPKHMKRIT